MHSKHTLQTEGGGGTSKYPQYHTTTHLTDHNNNIHIRHSDIVTRIKHCHHYVAWYQRTVAAHEQERTRVVVDYGVVHCRCKGGK